MWYSSSMRAFPMFSTVPTKMKGTRPWKRREEWDSNDWQKGEGCRFIRTYLVVMCCSYLFSRPLALVVAFDLDANHSRLVHDVLDVPTVLPNHFRWKIYTPYFWNVSGKTSINSLKQTDEISRHLDSGFVKLKHFTSFAHRFVRLKTTQKQKQ